MLTLFPTDPIQDWIVTVRGHRVLLQTDLARLYGLTASRLLAHAQRFPGDFCFPLEPAENAGLFDDRWDPRQRPCAFTEHGALLVGYLIGTPESVEMSVRIARAFVGLRRQSTHARDLAAVGR